MRLIVALLITTIAAPLIVAPTSTADPLWDFIVRYRHSGDETSFYLVGMIHSVIECPDGWYRDQVIAMLAPSSLNEIRVFGSYSSSVLRFEEQSGSRMNVTTFTCPTSATLRPVLGTTVSDGNNWHPYFINDWSTAPTTSQNLDRYAIATRPCMAIHFEGSSTLPFTGTIRYRNEGLGWKLLQDSGTWIANTLWDLSDDASATSVIRWCWRLDPWSAGQGYQVVDSGNTGVAPVGGWRASPYYCAESTTTCLYGNFP